jgi:hypothetical protein
MTKTIPYDQLEQLINAYFHQDWTEEHENEESVLADFVRTNWQEDVQLTVVQIKQYLTEHPNGLLESFTSDFTPMIIIGTGDTEAKAWLENVCEYLLGHSSDSPVRNG